MEIWNKILTEIQYICKNLTQQSVPGDCIHMEIYLYNKSSKQSDII